MKTPRYSYRFYLLTIILLIGFYILIHNLYELQVLKQSNFQEKVSTDYTVKVRLPGVRGEIVDRNDIPLASNVRNNKIVLNLKAVEMGYKARVKELEMELRSKGLKVSSVQSIDDIVEYFIAPQIRKYGIDVNFNRSSLQSHYRTHKGLVPFVLKDGLSYDEVALVAEGSADMKGVSITVEPRRRYPNGALAAHLIGYVRPWEKDYVSEMYEHYIGDERGVSGVEATMNAMLKGLPTVRTILKSQNGKIIKIVDEVKAVEGSEIKLSIDSRIQYLTEEVLKFSGRAAAVVMKADTGEILSMASVPNFNPNHFIPRITQKNYNHYIKNKGAPFLNRAINKFPPGSIFKIPTAIANSIVNRSSYYHNCSGYIPYGRNRIHCWKKSGHGRLNLSRAIQYSCNPFFMKIGNKLGSEKMAEIFGLLGFGKKVGIRLPQESSGILPGSTSWKRMKRGKSMTPSLTGMLAIGQGDSEATPLQVASLIGAVANGGTLYQPRLVIGAMHRLKKDEVVNEPIVTADLLELGLRKEDLKEIRKGMYLAVNGEGGTASNVAMTEFKVAAKTGTAQTIDLGQKTHVAWTAAFAPYDNPKYIVVVAVKRGGSGGKVAGPLVKLILKGLAAYEKGYALPLKPQANYAGNIDLIEKITLPTERDPLESLFEPLESSPNTKTHIIIHKSEED